MSFTPMQQKNLKVYLLRKIITMPFFIMMLISLLIGGIHGFRWIKGRTSWHQAEAVITLVTEEQNYQYSYVCKKEGKSYKGAVLRPKLFWYFPYKEDLQKQDTLAVSYYPDRPQEHIVFAEEESDTITWCIIFIFCFGMYCHLDFVLKHKK